MTNSNVIGIIDMGTNSLRLMVANGERVIHKSLITTRLGENISNTHAICRGAADRTAEALITLKKRAFSLGAGKVVAFATSAVRDAKNRDEFLAEMKLRTGFDIDVISGAREAQLGVLGTLKGGDGGIIDIGGGSTEIQFVQGGQTVYFKSFEVGVVRWLSMFPRSEQEGFQQCIDFTRKVFEELENIKAVQPVYGIGGTATSLSAVHMKMDVYDGSKVQDSVLTLDILKNQFAYLTSLTLSEREHVSGLDAERADIVPFSCIIMMTVLKALRLTSILVSDRDNLEGYLTYIKS